MVSKLTRRQEVQRRLAERDLYWQANWIAERGGSLRGYINFYRKYHRTDENIEAIYNADRKEFQRIIEKVRRLPNVA